MNTFLDILFLQAEGGQGSPGGGSWTTFLMFGAIIVVFYFFMIRPQQKKQKQEQNFRDALERGDKVTTIGGLHGKIISVGDGTAKIELTKGVEITVEKAALKPVVEGSAKK